MSRQFNKDELFVLALEMDLSTLINFCKTNKRINKEVCGNDNLWYGKVLKEFPDYKKLKVKDNKTYKEIYSILYQLTQLKSKLKLKNDIYQIYKSKNLSVSFESLKSIPKEIGVLVNLEEIYIGNNYITEIPKEIGNLVKLKQLWLTNNQIVDIPKEIGNMKKLQLLDLQKNNIKIVPKELAYLPKLQKLNLSFNPIEEFSEELKRKIKEENMEFTIFDHQKTLKPETKLI
jgi:Leucine-rich repeat (LRR) protein